MNNHIVISKVQADAIRGRHGLYSAIEPVPTPDGNYIVPENCISDIDLSEVKSTLEGYVTTDNVKDIVDLPAVGELCTAGMIYKYSEGVMDDPDSYSGLIKCVQTHNRTIYSPRETPALFSFFRKNSDDLLWIENEYVYLGWKRMYNDVQYEVLQEHMTLSTWTPEATLGVLWKVATQPSVEWQAGVAYNIDDIVSYLGSNYKCLQAHTSQIGWEPSITPTLWQLQV